MGINTPWKVDDLTAKWPNDPFDPFAFRWGIADCWGVIIGRFDTQEHAQRAVDAVNHEVIKTP